MTPVTQGRTARALVLLTVVAAVAAVALAPVAVTAKQITVGATAVAFACAGAVIVARRRGHLVGWLLVAAAADLAVTEVLGVYAFRGLVVSPGSLPETTWVAWVNGWLGVPGFAAAAMVLPLLFPDGRLPSHRWRVLLWLIVLTTVVQVLAQMVGPGAVTLTDPVDGSTDVPVADNPLAIGIAVLCYRLYEIDRIISRTAAYAVVTTVLVGVYGVLTVVPAAVLGMESDLFVAAATLLVVALFVPLRTRVQTAVDRRFDRARYDATGIVDGFGTRLRHDVAAAVVDELRSTVVAAVRPTRMSVWLARERVR